MAESAESVGTITLDLEVKSDLKNQVKTLSGAIGKEFKNSLSSTGKSGMNDFKTAMKQSLKSTMGEARTGLGNMQKLFKTKTAAMAKTLKNGLLSSLKALSQVKQPQTKQTFKTAQNQTKPSTTARQPNKTRGPPANREALQAEIANTEGLLNNTNAQIEATKAKLNELKAARAKAFDTATKNRLDSEVLKTEASMLKLIGTSDKLGFKLADLDQKFEQAGAGATQSRSRIQAFTQVLKNAAGRLQSFTTGVRNSDKASKKANNSYKQSTRGAGGFMSMIMKWGIIFPIIQRSIIAMATSLGQSLMTNAQFANSLNQIKTNLMVAFMPIYNAVLPAINALMSALAKISSMIASFTASLFGTTYSASYQAAQGMIAAKDAMGVYGNAAGSAADKTKKAKKELLGLAAFDELNLIGSAKTDTDSDAGGGGSDAPVLSEPMETDMTGAAGRVGDILRRFFIPFKEAWAAEGVNTVNAIKYAFTNVWGLIKAIGKSFLEVWTNGSGTRMLTLILKICQDIFGIIGDIAGSFTHAWETAGLGTKIIQGVFDIINNVLYIIHGIGDAFREVWSKVGDTVATTFLGIINSVISVLKTLSDVFRQAWDNGGSYCFQQILIFAAKVFEIVGYLINNVFAPLLSYVLQTFAPTWGNFFQIIGNIFELFTNLLSGNWSAAWDSVKAIFSSAGEFLKSTFNAVFNGVLVPILNFFGGIISSVVSSAKSVFYGFGDWLSSVFTRDWTTRFGVFGNILNGFFATVNGIFEGVKSIFSGIIDFIAGVFTGNWSRAWQGIVNIFGGIFGTLGSIMRAPLNAVISLVNSAIYALNRIHVNIPSWVPGFGGKSFGFSIPSIPYLARGGVIDQPTLAMVGESGKEAVMPLENNTGWMNTLADNIAGRVNTDSRAILDILRMIYDLLKNQDSQSGDLILMVENTAIGKIAIKEIKKMIRQNGGSFNLGVL